MAGIRVHIYVHRPQLDNSGQFKFKSGETSLLFISNQKLICLTLFISNKIIIKLLIILVLITEM